MVWLKVSELAAKYSVGKITVSATGKRVLKQLACACCGFISANGSVFGEYAPFGVSLAAAMPFEFTLSSFLGSSVGYVFFYTGRSNFRYIAAMLAVIAIRWTLNDIKSINRHSFYNAVVCFVPTLATGIAIMGATGFERTQTFIYITEALLGAVAAYFFSKTVIIINGTKSLGMLLPQELACLVLCGCVGILSLSRINIGFVSVGRAAAVLAVLFAARYGGITGGTVVGICTGVVLGMTHEQYFFLGSAYTFGGLISGLFSPVGRIAQAGAMFVAAAALSFQSRDLGTVVIIMSELAAASAVFLILPKNTLNALSAVFTSDTAAEHCQGLRRSIIMRLDFAAKALADISSDVEDVSEKLSKIVTPTIDGVYKNAVAATCSRCGMRVFCWEHRDGVSLSSFEELNETLTQNGSIEPKDFREDFRNKCCRQQEMANSVNRSYKSYLASEAAAKRIDEVRAVVAGQFCGLGDILGELADEYENYEIFDEKTSDRIFLKLKDLGLVPLSVSCHIDYLGRMSIEAEIRDGNRKQIKRALLLREMTKICGRSFDTPVITAAFGRCRIAMSERAGFDVEIAASQHICGGGTLCGDSLKYFNDGTGRMTAILSDGMGTGGRAAVDGTMTVSIMSKLIKAGLGFDSSLKVVNSALLVKSEDESLATLDIACIDLYTGEAEFMKAGAALTFIKKDGDMYRVDTPSLPLGILPEVGFSHTAESLQSGDIIVMVSDGAINDGEDWIEKIIFDWQEKSMQELSDLINDEACRRRCDGHDDDITVIAMRLKAA